jgi:hypothetical protein
MIAIEAVTRLIATTTPFTRSTKLWLSGLDL